MDFDFDIAEHILAYPFVNTSRQGRIEFQLDQREIPQDERGGLINALKTQGMVAVWRKNPARAAGRVLMLEDEDALNFADYHGIYLMHLQDRGILHRIQDGDQAGYRIAFGKDDPAKSMITVDALGPTLKRVAALNILIPKNDIYEIGRSRHFSNEKNVIKIDNPRMVQLLDDAIRFARPAPNAKRRDAPEGSPALDALKR